MAAVRAAFATGKGIRRRSVLSNRATDRAEDAPGSKLAVLAQAKMRGRNRITGNRSVRSRPSHPRSLHHGSRLPAMSRVGPQALWKARKEGSRLVPVPLTHLARRFDRRVVSDHSALAISGHELAQLTCGDTRGG